MHTPAQGILLLTQRAGGAASRGRRSFPTRLRRLAYGGLLFHGMQRKSDCPVCLLAILMLRYSIKELPERGFAAYAVILEV